MYTREAVAINRGGILGCTYRRRLWEGALPFRLRRYHSWILAIILADNLTIYYHYKKSIRLFLACRIFFLASFSNCIGSFTGHCAMARSTLGAVTMPFAFTFRSPAFAIALFEFAVKKFFLEFLLYLRKVAQLVGI